MSLRSRIRALERARGGGAAGLVAFIGEAMSGGPVLLNGVEFPTLEAAQASCGYKIEYLLPCKMELADWIEARAHENHVTPATSGN